MFGPNAKAVPIPAPEQLSMVATKMWLNKRWPLAEATDVWNSLAHGRWIVLLHSPTCGHCGPVLQEYSELAERWKARGRTERIAVLETGDPLSVGEAPGTPLPAAVLAGKVSLPENQIIVSPTLVILIKGRVVAVEEGVIGCVWNSAKEARLRTP